MSNSAQIKLENEMRSLDGSTPNVNYIRELASLGLTEVPIDNKYLKNQIKLTPTLEMENNKAKIVGLSDTTAMLGDIGLKSNEIHIQPYAIEFQESNIGADNTVIPLVSEIFGRLSKQKDELAISKLNTLATAGSNITLDETFLNIVIQNLETQKQSSGINQGIWGILIANDLKIKLMNLFYAGTAVSVWDKFEQYMSSLGLWIYVSTIISDVVYIFEKNQLQLVPANEPKLEIAYTDGHGVLENKKWQFTFSNDDFILHNNNCLVKYPVVALSGKNVVKEGKNVVKDGTPIVQG